MIIFSKYRDEQHGRNNDRFVHFANFASLPKFVFFAENADQSQVYLVPLEAENDSPNVLGVAPRPINYGWNDGILWLFDETSIDSLNISGESIDIGGGLTMQQISWNGKKCYYRIITQAGNVFESNVFEFQTINNANLAYPQRRESLLKFVWNGASHINDIEWAGIPHENELYLYGFLENPEFIENIESETDGNGRVIQLFSRTEKLYNVRIIAPEYIYKGLLDMKLHTNRLLFDGRNQYEILNLAIEKEFFCKENGFDYFVLNLKITVGATFG